MSRRVRGALIGVAAACAALGSAGTATALTVTPAGSYSAGAPGSLSWRLVSTGQTTPCDGSLLSFTLASDGRGSIPAGGVSFTRCSLSAYWSYQQAAPWPIEVVLSPASPSGVQIGWIWTIPRGGLRVGSPGCSGTAGGQITFAKSFAGPLPIAVTTTNVLTAVSSAVTIDSANCPLLAVGLSVTFAGSYGFSRALTVAG